MLEDIIQMNKLNQLLKFYIEIYPLKTA